MKFINRVSEIDYIKETIKLSKNRLFSLSILGLRRVGKTRLIFEILSDNDIYFFVNKNKESRSLLGEYEAILKEKRVLNELESLRNWDDYFDIIFKRFKGIIAFDEFQNFINVDNTIFGILQKYIDLNENKKKLLFIFLGSSIGLMKKLFLNSKEPLYGRIKRKIELQPFSFKDCIDIYNELKIKNIEEIIELYCIFGGYPKYYCSIEDENLLGKSREDIIDRFFFQKNAILEEEVSQILSLEFGKRSGIYYDILTAIANGSTRISEIASFLRKKETSLTRQINELINYFGLIGVKTPVIAGRNLFYIKHPLIDFWFRFFYKNLSSYKIREPRLIKKINDELNYFIGKKFENVCYEFIGENFRFTKIGKQWGKFKGQKGKNTYEIDVVALSEKNREILFAECKWKSKVNALKVIKQLEEKTKYVQWNNEDRKESYAIFAKSFNKKIREFNGKKVYCYDLEDLEDSLKKI